MKNIFHIIILLSFTFSTETTYILCEGDFYSNEASLWIEQNNQIYESNDNPLGNIGQSMTITNNQLFVILNGSSKIIVYDINQSNGNIDYSQTIDTFDSSPRELFVINNLGFLSEWNTQVISIYDLNTFEIIASIPIDGLPESMVTDGEYLYVSVILNSDWSNGNLVLVIDLDDYSIVNSYDVGIGPGKMILLNNIIWISRTYYDVNWDEFTGTSTINLETGEIYIQDYGINSLALCGGDIVFHENSIYRTWNGGIAMLDDNLEIMPETQIGNYEYDMIYSMATNGDKIYLGLSDDYLTPDEVIVLDFSGNEIAHYNVGGIPGSFAFWNTGLSMTKHDFINDGINLFGNYPNPFNPETNITFYINETNNVDLVIYNLLGQVIHKENNKIYPAGYNSITYLPDNELSGIYFYQISSFNLTKTGRMMIIK